MPQAPQLEESVCVLRQLPLQDVKPAEQTHAPLLQTWFVPHALPQAPQLAGSFTASHTFPQYTPLTQVQALAEHTWPVSHACEQAPQFAGSDDVSVHVPAQTVRPELLQTQAPLMHS